MADKTVVSGYTAVGTVAASDELLLLNAAGTDEIRKPLSASAASLINDPDAFVTGAHKAYVGIIALYTALATDHVIEATAGTFTVTLPTAVGIQGKEYRVKNSGAGVTTVDADGAETIDGAATAVLATQYDSVTLVSNGTNWIIN